MKTVKDDPLLPETGADRIARSRSELTHVLTEKPINPAFPRSRTMRALNGSGPLLLAGVAMGLMVVKPRWSAKLLRLLPMVRMLKRMNQR